MKKGYLFIANSSKPSKEVYNSVDDIKLPFLTALPVQCALQHGYVLYGGLNRKYADRIKCSDGYDIRFYNQHTFRSIFALRDNLIAFINLKKFLKEHPEIEFIHCNTPIGGMIGRVCGRLYGVKTVIYTAHGFHFYKGAPLFNRTILKWVEMFLAHWTDAILTMNKEDYQAASKFKLRNNGKAYYVPGVGVDTESFLNITIDRAEIKKSLGIPTNAIMAIAMGDIVPRKNYRVAIEAVSKANRSNLHYIICGRGPQIEELKKYALTLGIGGNIHFLGFRNDIKQLALSSDLFLFSSTQEGLPRSTMEAMCAGLPCIISAIRGHVDLIDNNQGGLLCPVNDVNAYAVALQKFVDNPEYRKEQGLIAKQRIKQFDYKVVKQRLSEIYDDILKDK